MADWLNSHQTNNQQASGGVSSGNNDWLSSFSSGGSAYKPNRLVSDIKPSVSVTTQPSKNVFSKFSDYIFGKAEGDYRNRLTIANEQQDTKTAGEQAVNLAEIEKLKQEGGAKRFLNAIKVGTGRTVKNIKSSIGNFSASLLDSATYLYETNLEKKKERAQQLEASGSPLAKSYKALNLPKEGEDQRVITRDISNKIKKWSEETAPTNPDFLDAVVQGTGSMGAFMLTSLVTGGGAIYPAILESLSESGSVYEQLRDQGKSVNEASVGADKDLTANIFINYFTDKFGVFSDKLRGIKKAISSATAEGVQEGLQQLASNDALGKEGMDVFEGVLESMGVGSILGGTASFIMPGGGEITVDTSGNVTESVGGVSQEPLKPIEEQASKFTSAKDFATTQGTTEDKQIGIVKSSNIIARDAVDTTTEEYQTLKADIQKNGVQEPIIVQVKKDGTIETTDGSHRTQIAQELGIDVPVIVTKGEIPGLKTIQEVYDQAVASKPAEEVKPIKEEKPVEAKTKIDPLIEEARKYKSADEFVDAMGKELAIDRTPPNPKDGYFAIGKREFLPGIGTKELDEVVGATNKFGQPKGWVEQLTDIYNQAQKEKEPNVKKKPKTAPKRSEQPTVSKEAPTKETETKASKVAVSIEQKVNQTFENLAGFETVNIKDQARRVKELIDTDINKAKRILAGSEPIPNDLRAGSLIVGLEQYAIENNDIDLLRDLAVSPLVAETSIHAQELRLLAERDNNSVATKVRELANERAKIVEKKKGKSVKKLLKEETAKIKSNVKKVNKTDWSSFVKSIEC